VTHWMYLPEPPKKTVKGKVKRKFGIFMPSPAKG